MKPHQKNSERPYWLFLSYFVPILLQVGVGRWVVYLGDELDRDEIVKILLYILLEKCHGTLSPYYSILNVKFSFELMSIHNLCPCQMPTISKLRKVKSGWFTDTFTSSIIHSHIAVLLWTMLHFWFYFLCYQSRKSFNVSRTGATVGILLYDMGHWIVSAYGLPNNLFAQVYLSFSIFIVEPQRPSISKFR